MSRSLPDAANNLFIFNNENAMSPLGDVAAKQGFVQVRIAVAAINSSAYPGSGSGLTNIAKHWF